MLAGLVSRIRRLKRWRLKKAGVEKDTRAPRRRLVLPGDPTLIYAIGDVHGCYRQLRIIEDAIVRDGSGSAGLKMIVMLGDYIDRGPESAAVLDHLSQPPPEGFRRVCLCGNHEEVFLRLLNGEISIESWLNFGGEQTLLSYGLDLRTLAARGTQDRDLMLQEIVRAVPPAHRAFLETLPASVATKSYYFAHAGARPGIALEDQNERDLLWIRDDFLRGRSNFEKIVVYGHTPMPSPLVDARRVGIDTGASMGGKLTAARFHGGAVTFVQVE